jgi:anti-sigma B factor antagonist
VTADALPVIDVRRAAIGRAPGLAVRGEVDAASAPLLEEALDGAIRETAGAFVLDLAAVRFLDSSGLNLLLRARALLGRGDRAIVLVCPPGPVRRVLELAGVDDLFALYATRAEAETSLG